MCSSRTCRTTAALPSLTCQGRWKQTEGVWKQMEGDRWVWKEMGGCRAHLAGQTRLGGGDGVGERLHAAGDVAVDGEHSLVHHLHLRE